MQPTPPKLIRRAQLNIAISFIASRVCLISSGLFAHGCGLLAAGEGRVADTVGLGLAALIAFLIELASTMETIGILSKTIRKIDRRIWGG